MSSALNPDASSTSAWSPLRRVPAWLSSTRLAWAGALLGLAVLLLASAFAVQQRDELMTQELQHTQLMARLLEGETSRTLDTAEMALALVQQPLRQSPSPAWPEVSTRLADMLRSYPSVRSLSVLDAQGRIMASSTAALIGRSVDVAQLGQPVVADQAWLGAWQPGRDLGLSALGTPSHPPPAGLGFLPLARRFTTAEGSTLYALASLNPDYFANRFQQMLDERHLAAALLDYQGRLLAATNNIERQPGALLNQHRALRDYLPEQEFGSYQGLGLDAHPVLTSFRASHKQPLLIVVEKPVAEVMVAWQHRQSWIWLLVLGMVLIVASALGWRRLRTQERLAAALGRTHKRLEENERFVRTVFETTPAPLYVLDALGRFTLVNQAFEDFLAVKRDDLIGQHNDLSVTLRLLAYHPVHDAALWSSAQPSRYTDKFLASDGTLKHVHVTKLALPSRNGRPSGVVGTLLDITRYHEAEKRAAATVSATAAAYQSEATFVNHLSQALRTPLQSVVNFSDLGITRTAHEPPEQDATAHDTPKLHDLFHHIYLSGQRMLAVIEDLHQLSQTKLTAAAHPDTPHDTRLLVQEVVQHTQAYADTHDHLVSLTLHAEGDTTARVDVLRFQQAIRTLLERAVDHAPADSEIEIRAGRDGSGTLHWWIHDEGPGLWGADHEVQLAICQHILQGFGGDVQYASEASGGNVYHVYLPACPSGTPLTPDDSLPPASPRMPVFVDTVPIQIGPLGPGAQKNT